MRNQDCGYCIDGQPIPVPDADLEMSASDLDSPDSGRDESGVMHRFRVRERVRTWGFHYDLLTRQEYLYLKELMEGKTVFRFSYPGSGGVQESCLAYCAKVGYAVCDLNRGIYRNLKFNIIEC